MWTLLLRIAIWLAHSSSARKSLETLTWTLKTCSKDAQLICSNTLLNLKPTWMSIPFTTLNLKRFCWMTQSNNDSTERIFLKRSQIFLSLSLSRTLATSCTGVCASQLLIDRHPRPLSKCWPNFTTGGRINCSIWSTSCFVGGPTTQWALRRSKILAHKPPRCTVNLSIVLSKRWAAMIA